LAKTRGREHSFEIWKRFSGVCCLASNTDSRLRLPDSSDESTPQGIYSEQGNDQPVQANNLSRRRRRDWTEIEKIQLVKEFFKIANKRSGCWEKIARDLNHRTASACKNEFSRIKRSKLLKKYKDA
jgi:hypothetical protein